MKIPSLHAFAPLAVLSLLSLATTFGQLDSLARYKLGEIPDQTVWSGSSRLFLVESSGNAGAVLNLQAAPGPQGTLTLDLHEESQWLFRFVPAPAINLT